jgi:hypothetical protein
LPFAGSFLLEGPFVVAVTERAMAMKKRPEVDGGRLGGVETSGSPEKLQVGSWRWN